MTASGKNKTRRGGWGPRPIAAQMRKLAGPAIRRRGLAGAGVVTDWATIVGERLAAHCMPERLAKPRRRGETGGVLHLRVAPGWATELQHLEPMVIERINGYYGYLAVARLRLVQAPLPAATEPAAPSKPVRDPEADAAVARAVAGVEDFELRDSLAALGRAVAAHTKPQD